MLREKKVKGQEKNRIEPNCRYIQTSFLFSINGNKMVDVAMIKQTILVLSALSLTACVGTGTETANLSKPAGPQSVSACPGLTGVSAQYSVAVPGLETRCGPQTERPVTYK